jgi:RNA polymerase sigma factor (sigma-70 family)
VDPRELVPKLRPRIEKMASYYARRCGEDADDLLQEAWLGLLQALPALDPRIGSPEQYLIKHARWRLLDAVKRARIRRCVALDEEGAECLLPPDADEAHSSASVRDFTGRLKEQHRDLLACLMAGLTWREAGSALGYTSANVAYHVRQIRRQYEAWAVGDGGLEPQRR